MVKISESVKQAFDRLDALKNPDIFSKPVHTGFDDLDKLTTGFQKGELVILAARPGMGKTSFALNVASHLALVESKSVAFFSFEIGQEQLSSRILSSQASVEQIKLKTGNLSNEERSRLEQASVAISKTNSYIDDTTGITVPQMKTRLRELENIDLVIIDYLQLMSDPLCQNNKPHQKNSSIIFNLARMAKDLQVPVLVLSQLSRSVEKRDDHRPRFSDLRKVGAINHNADVVLFLYRDNYYNSYAEDAEDADENSAEIIVAKNRHGKTGTISLKWYGEYGCFASID